MPAVTLHGGTPNEVVIAYDEFGDAQGPNRCSSSEGADSPHWRGRSASRPRSSPRATA